MKDFDYTNAFLHPLFIAGSRITNPTFGEALTQAAGVHREQQIAQAHQQQAELKRQEALRAQAIAQSLPEVLKQLDWSNPNIAASQLAEIGVTDPAQIASLFNLYKNNEELGLAREKNLFERERLGNERQRLGFEQANLGFRGQELGLKAQEHMLKIQELQQRLTGNPSPEQAAKIESELRKEFTALKSTQNFETVKSAYENIREGYKEDNPAANLNMVYSFVHLLDPSSTVGPGEKISVENSRGLSEGMVARLNLLLGTGGYLGEKQRKDILQEAHKIYKNSNKTHKEKAIYYQGLAGKYKVQPENIIGAKPEEVEEIPTALNKEEDIIRQLKAAGLSDAEIANIGR